MLISSPYQNQIIWNTTDHRPETKLAIDYISLSNGNLSPIVWSADKDIYETTITTAGREDYINNIINELNKNYNNIDILTMSGFNSDESVFGEDVDHTVPISGIITDWSVVSQGSWKGFKLSLKLRCLSPTFLLDTAVPDLSGMNSSPNYKGGSIPIYNILDTYNGSVNTYFTKSYDRSSEFDINLTNSELAALRRYIAVNRGVSFSVSNIGGIQYPFGIQNAAATYNVIITDLKEQSRFNVNRWLVRITLHNVI